ncbi:MAG: DUF1800 family protein [Saprospiraceae bacterium]|nr:DUF1800 family protein [Saprospiraceae bacterium]
MDRRQLFQKLTQIDLAEDKKQAIPLGAGLNKYSGQWNYSTAAHLLRRAMFGPTHEQIKQAVTDGLDVTIAKLFTPTSLSTKPLHYTDIADPYVKKGETWVGQKYALGVQGLNQTRDNSLFSWIFQNIMNEGVSITEKMMLFWHNHFVVSEIFLANISYDYLTTIRKNVLGDFKQMTKDISINGAMLLYLNGNTNTNRAPNENYARELMELFTLGKGDLAGPGDYTTYTEQDILAIAKVLTGWITPQNRSTDSNGIASVLPTVAFNPNLHDASTKILSHRFTNAQISNDGANEYNNLIEIIFKKREAATFICTKLYRYFVYYNIDETIQADIIEGMADKLIANNFNVGIVLKELLSSDHFYSNEAFGALIRSPYDWAFNTMKALRMEVPSDYITAYNLFISIYRTLISQSQAYFDLPNVAGWPAYYQEPVFHEIWINSISYPLRYTMGQNIVNKRIGYRLNGQGNNNFGADVAEYALGFDTPENASLLVDQVVAHLLPQAITQAQKDFLKSKLLGPLTDAQWTNTWNTFKADPNRTQNRTAVEARLRPFLVSLTTMPEYQLS